MTVNVPLVESGHSFHMPWSTAACGVYMKMVVHLLGHLPALPDYRTLYLSEVRFFYESLRSSLEKMTTPQPTNTGQRRK